MNYVRDLVVVGLLFVCALLLFFGSLDVETTVPLPEEPVQTKCSCGTTAECACPHLAGEKRCGCKMAFTCKCGECGCAVQPAKDCGCKGNPKKVGPVPSPDDDGPPYKEDPDK